ncbi:NAD(P)/FAD-dependent oxidoreductase [Geobacter sp. AOG1]|uniref:NAD(P)/FAD-dependent oxidoreductase n=1 Tax=Geobacter sp. AOG1 TaxID=1566346 RepID=UPI001CC4D763|nr:FAD-dependent monooxygenase [Geobacter sp. AOG1]GFE57964.1 hypothetical protein AOG1_18440 [Geobacter sp. AOG1]
MPFLLRNLILNLDEVEEQLKFRLCGRFGLKPAAVLTFNLVRKGIDARKKPRIKFVCTVEFTLDDEEGFWRHYGDDPDLERISLLSESVLPHLTTSRRIVIVGAGPAGLFTALRLTEYGLSPLLLERGKPVADRVRDVQTFWSEGNLDPESNVQFGEGGAGTFSDGKLTTRVKDPNTRYVLDRLVQFGAPPEILWLAKPHIGTDRLRGVVTSLRRHLEAQGVTVRFQSRLSGLVAGSRRLGGVIIDGREEYPCDILVLAPGHSARDTYGMLAECQVLLEPKPFAIGVRVEHPQELINRIQYGIASHPRLPPADYQLTYNNPRTGRSAYSFCMCPGGVVVASTSEKGGVVTNGMSGHLRNAPFANSALVVTVGRGDFPGSGPLAGVEFQRHWERLAFREGGGDYRAPAQNMLAFLGQPGSHPLTSSYRPGVRETDLAQVLPDYVVATLREGLLHFDRKMRGFVTGEATLTGVETRTSAPLRIVRGEDFQSVSLEGLYPAGEGAGYAGGIMSAALDGIRVADAIAAKLM